MSLFNVLLQWYLTNFTTEYNTYAFLLAEVLNMYACTWCLQYCLYFLNSTCFTLIFYCFFISSFMCVHAQTMNEYHIVGVRF